jgi:hypothetical protein
MKKTGARKLGVLERLQIARCVRGARLACGCQVGLYETLEGRVMTVVDSPHDACTDRAHQADFVIAEELRGHPSGVGACGAAA